jgi:glycosyltransferase involved in cell wall biosynthesis
MSLRDFRVTVIMACHNSSAYLSEAISSVLGQTLGDLELILIDDCSTDNTLEIAKRYQVQDSRVSVISLAVNSGTATARNAGIHAARGEWLGILDSDDVATPSRFEEQLTLASSDQRLVMIGSGSIWIDKNGHAIRNHKYPTKHQDLIKRLLSLRAFPPHSSMLYRKDVVRRLASFNPRFALSGDYDLWLRLSEVGKMACIDKPLVKIRKHDRNISNAEGGMLQTKFGYVASICHALRTHSYLDPSASSDETTWQEFLVWVERRLLEEGVFERRKEWADAHAGYFATENGVTGALRFGIRLLQSRHASALVWEKFFGSSLPQRLAREWMAATIQAK